MGIHHERQVRSCALKPYNGVYGHYHAVVIQRLTFELLHRDGRARTVVNPNVWRRCAKKACRACLPPNEVPIRLPAPPRDAFDVEPNSEAEESIMRERGIRSAGRDEKAGEVVMNVIRVVRKYYSYDHDCPEHTTA